MYFLYTANGLPNKVALHCFVSIIISPCYAVSLFIACGCSD